MPERRRWAETLHIGAPRHVGAATLLAIERSVSYAEIGPERLGFWLTRHPFAVVVRDAQGTRAIGVHAEDVSLDELRQRVDGLDAALALL